MDCEDVFGDMSILTYDLRRDFGIALAVPVLTVFECAGVKMSKVEEDSRDGALVGVRRSQSVDEPGPAGDGGSLRRPGKEDRDGGLGVDGLPPAEESPEPEFEVAI
jgi:hypothetical protein